MLITLKNNQKVDLQWNFLVLEYLEEYTNEEGTGILQLKRDISRNKNSLKVSNYFLYAIIRANIEEPLSYREAVSLVSFKDYKKIVSFIEKNLSELEEFKKKDRKFTQGQKRKKPK